MKALLLAVGLGWLVEGHGPLTGPDGLPEPAHDVPGAFDEVSAAFDARLRAAHPPGGDAARLREALLAEGFAVGADGEARLTRPGFLCEMTWLVRWTEAKGAIATIKGERAGLCM